MGEKVAVMTQQGQGDVEITAAELRRLLDYDQETGVFTWKVQRTGSVKIGSPAGRRNKRGYILIGLYRRKHMGHRLAWLHVHGEWPPNEIDHINNNPSDNRLANLRLATSSQNKVNTRLQSNNTSGVKGVYWNTSHRRGQARISVNGTRLNLGSFDNIEDAAKAYQRAAIENFGPFVRSEQ